jgi:F-type H+-transporting ATPase subunit epsilon
MAGESSFFQLEVVTPETMFYQGDVQMVEFNTSEGQIGVYKGHIPITTVVAPGTLTISIGMDKKKANLVSGFAEILPNRIRILAEEISWLK